MSDFEVQAASKLDDSIVSEFSANGWALAKGFFSPQETVWLQRLTEEVTSMPEQIGAQMVYGEQSLVSPDTRLIQRVEHICPHHPEFDSFARGGRLIAAVEQLMGDRAVLFKDKMNLKMPGGAGFEAHQDQQAGWGKYAPVFVTALVCIDAATIENGCLEFSTGVRYTDLIGSEWTPLSQPAIAALKFRPIPTEPGDVMFFDSFAPHQSAPNLSPRRRRLMYLTYNLASDGDWREAYFAAKRASFPPDIERQPGTSYRFRV